MKFEFWNSKVFDTKLYLLPYISRYCYNTKHVINTDVKKRICLKKK